MPKFLALLTVCLLAAPAGAQAYDPFTDPISDYEGYDPLDTPIGRLIDRTPRKERNLTQEMEEKWHRQKIEAYILERSVREEEQQNHHNYLHWCAPYNRGCAQELYGN